jgi:hypothetical protein
MDPVSTIASVLTLLGAAGGTIKFIHSSITAIIEAPDDTKRQNRRIECLSITLTNVVRACEQLPDEFRLDLKLCGIEEFIVDTKSIEAKLTAKRIRTTSSTMLKFHESCKWLLSDREFKRFFESVDHWNTILSQALWALQMSVAKIGVQILFQALTRI